MFGSRGQRDLEGPAITTSLCRPLLTDTAFKAWWERNRGVNKDNRPFLKRRVVEGYRGY